LNKMIIEIKVPSPGESITEVEIASWLVKDGDFVEKDQEVCDIDSDKATLTLSAEEGGKIKLIAKPETTIRVGDVICTIDTSVKGKAKKQTKETTEEVSVVKETKETASNVGLPSVSAKKIMKENQINEIKGNGKSGRITKQDVLNSINKNARGSRKIKKQRMSSLRRKIAQRLVSVKNKTAMLTTFNEVDMSAIISIRKKVQPSFEKRHKTKLGFMSFFTKAVVSALKEFPVVNAQIEGENIILQDFYDVGVAVSTEKGLMVPVLRNSELMSFSEIETEIKLLSSKARDGKIKLEELSGGTFTITNGGVFGSMLSTPIINPPQSAILGMHNIVNRPIAINGNVEIRPIMYVALSYDHRIIDGKDSVGFLVHIKNCLENPIALLMNNNLKKGLNI